MKSKIFSVVVFGSCIVLVCILRQVIHTQNAIDLPEIDLMNKQFVIVVPSFNNKDWYTRNIDSIAKQTYKHFRVIYIDDNSEDDTAQLVEQYVQHNFPHLDFTLIKNTVRCGALANIYRAVHSCKNTEIIVTVDGDDWLSHDQVLTILNTVYQNPNVWVTYGQYVTFCGAKLGLCQLLPQWVIDRNCYRSYQWVSSHLRTFYAGLFKQIKKEDLLYQDDFFTVTWDAAFMYPLLEMAAGKYAYIPDILYIYNDANPINDYKVRLALLKKCEYIIRNREPYKAIKPEVLFG